MVGIKTIIGSKGQVVIPKQLRDEFDLNPGQIVEFDQENDNIIIKKSIKDPVKILLEMKELMKTKHVTKEDLKKLDWDKIYEEEIESRAMTRKWKR